MPELPEVETVRRGLQLAMEGARFDAVEARRPDLRFPLPRDFVKRLQGKTVRGLGRRDVRRTRVPYRNPVYLGGAAACGQETGHEEGEGRAAAHALQYGGERGERAIAHIRPSKG